MTGSYPTQSLLELDMSRLADADVVVLAGGMGTRLRSVLGENVPKLLAPIGPRPYVEYLFDWLQGFGASRIILSLGHLATAIKDYVEAHPRTGLTIDTIVEDEPLGTAGALRLVRPHVRTQTAFLMNGDSWIDADLNALMVTHEKQAAPATLLCVGVDDAGRYGRIERDESGYVTAFCEKEENAVPGLINAGMYAVSEAGWQIISDLPGPSLERDVFAKAPAHSLYTFDAGQTAFIDIGTPDSLAIAADIIGQRKAHGDST